MSWEDNEEKKKYLRGYREAKRRESRILEQIQRLRLDEMLPCLQSDDMPRSHNQTDLSDYAAKLDELMEELKEERMHAVVQYERAYRAIKCMEEEIEREVLVRRYINGDKWEKIALDMGYDYRYILKIHGKALENFEIPQSGH